MGGKFFRNFIKGFACLAIALLAMANKPCFADDSYLMTFFPREGNTGGYSQNLYSGLDNNFFFDLNRAFLFREVDKGVTYNPVNSIVKPLFDSCGITSSLGSWDVLNPQYFITVRYVSFSSHNYLLVEFTKGDGFINTNYSVSGSSQVYPCSLYPHLDIAPVINIYSGYHFVYPITCTSESDNFAYLLGVSSSSGGYPSPALHTYLTTYFAELPYIDGSGVRGGSLSSGSFIFRSGSSSDIDLKSGFDSWVSSSNECLTICVDLDNSLLVCCSGAYSFSFGYIANNVPISKELLFSYGYVYHLPSSSVCKVYNSVNNAIVFKGTTLTSPSDYLTLVCNKYFLTNARPTTTPMPTPTDIPPWRDADLPTPTGYPSVTVAPLPTGIVTDYIPLLDIPSNENVLSNITGIIKEFNSIFTRKVFSLGSYTLQVMYYFSGWFKFIFIVPAGVFIAFLIGRLRKK